MVHWPCRTLAGTPRLFSPSAQSSSSGPVTIDYSIVCSQSSEALHSVVTNELLELQTVCYLTTSYMMLQRTNIQVDLSVLYFLAYLYVYFYTAYVNLVKTYAVVYLTSYICFLFQAWVPNRSFKTLKSKTRRLQSVADRSLDSEGFTPSFMKVTTSRC